MTANQIKRQLSKRLQADERTLASLLGQLVVLNADSLRGKGGGFWSARYWMHQAVQHLAQLKELTVAHDVATGLIDLITHPMPLSAEDFADLARGRLGRFVGPLAPLPDMRQYDVMLLAAFTGRGLLCPEMRDMGKSAPPNKPEVPRIVLTVGDAGEGSSSARTRLMMTR